MTKAILLSVRSEHAVKILNGKQTLLLQKRVPKDFVGWVYIYVTKARPLLQKKGNVFIERESYARAERIQNIVNGKAVARFWFDEYEKISFFREYKADGECGYCYMQSGSDRNITRQSFLNKACISEEEIIEWNNDSGKPFYAWHIKKLEIFDEPMELENFYTRNDMLDGLYFERKAYQFECVKKAPKGWRYVWVD